MRTNKSYSSTHVQHVVGSVTHGLSRSYSRLAGCVYVLHIGLHVGVVPTFDLAHYEYHYLSSGACVENRCI